MRVNKALLLSVTAVVSVGVASTSVFSAPAVKVQMTTGNEKLSYHNVFGKDIKDKLKKFGVEVELVTSAGSVENIKRLQEGKAQLGLAQADVYATEIVKTPALAKEVGAYGELDHECLVGVVSAGTGSDQLTKIADKATFGVGGAGTGSKMTFEFLAKNNPYFGKITPEEDNTMSGALPKVMSGAFAGMLVVTKIDEKNDLITSVAKQYEQTVPKIKFMKFDDASLGELKMAGKDGKDKKIYSFVEVSVPVKGKAPVVFPTICVATELLVSEKTAPKELKDALAKIALGEAPPKNKFMQKIDDVGGWFKSHLPGGK